jgi:hypothetical protein
MVSQKIRWNSIFESVVAALSIGLIVLFRPLLRRWYLHWGATESEAARMLPGDELVPHPRVKYTRGITIEATPDRIWPWLVQMGQGKGGLYSYEHLENLAGCDIHNTDRILPQFQNVKVGDLVQLGPKGYPAFTVLGVHPQEALVLAAADVIPEPHDQQLPDPLPAEYTLSNWVFYLNPITPHSTRLLVRGWLDYEPNSWKNWLIWRLLTEPIAFVMERKMMRGIKRRAEVMTREDQRPIRVTA